MRTGERRVGGFRRNNLDRKRAHLKSPRAGRLKRVPSIGIGALIVQFGCSIAIAAA